MEVFGMFPIPGFRLGTDIYKCRHRRQERTLHTSNQQDKLVAFQQQRLNLIQIKVSNLH